jgi:hypothetical protein
MCPDQTSRMTKEWRNTMQGSNGVGRADGSLGRKGNNAFPNQQTRTQSESHTSRLSLHRGKKQRRITWNRLRTAIEISVTSLSTQHQQCPDRYIDDDAHCAGVPYHWVTNEVNLTMVFNPEVLERDTSD